MLAFEHGAVVEGVRVNYPELYLTLGKDEAKLEKNDKFFVEKVFVHFRLEKDETLENLFHGDPAWKLGKEKGNLQIMPLNEKLLNYYSDFLENTLEEIGV